MLSRERRLFFLRWLRSPHNVGVPVPSGKKLASAMAGQLASVTPEEYVVELGPGTGVITRALCKSNIKQEKLIIIELDAHFIEPLKKEFPKSIILQGDARHLKELLHKHGIHEVAAVVSSLPFLSMPDSICKAIVNSVFEVLKPEGAFVLYTYGPISPVSKGQQRHMNINGRIAKRIWRNFPPARVWRYTANSAI